MSAQGLCLAIVGATGAVGRELVDLLEERAFPVRELRLYATGASMGEDVEFGSELLAVETDAVSLRGADLVFLCTPAGVSLELIREALRAEVSCIDCSGALLGSPEVPMVLSGVSPPGASVGAPVVSTPGGVSLVGAQPLSLIDAAAGIKRVVGTVLHSASSSGRAGIEALSSQTIALLSQREPELHGDVQRELAFDCLPLPEAASLRDEAAGPGPEQRVATELSRLLGHSCEIALASVQVPTFVGVGCSFAVETERPLSPEEAAEIFEKAESLELWEPGRPGPTTRDTTGSSQVLVGLPRRDTTVDNGLWLWATGDPLRLAARNLVDLAELRLHLN